MTKVKIVMTIEDIKYNVETDISSECSMGDIAESLFTVEYSVREVRERLMKELNRRYQEEGSE